MYALRSIVETMDERARRVAKNEALVRLVNERGLEGGSWRPGEEFEIVCECGDVDCLEYVRVTTETYERTRSRSTDFLIQAGHEKPDLETVVEDGGHLRIVRKTGEAATLVAREDPRRYTDAVRADRRGVVVENEGVD
jgi:hypothetical protein